MEIEEELPVLTLEEAVGRSNYHATQAKNCGVAASVVYRDGNGADAKLYSDKRKKHKSDCEELNRRIVELIKEELRPEEVFVVPPTFSMRDIRSLAMSEGKKMSESFLSASMSYKAHNGELAKVLSDKGKFHQERMKQLNQLAENAFDVYRRSLIEIEISEEQIAEVRAEANSLQRSVIELARMSQEAYENGEKGTAKLLSDLLRVYKIEVEQLNTAARNAVIESKNKDKNDCELDLHGLYVKEALEALRSRVCDDISSGRELLRVIVGKGIHSQGNELKLDAAVFQIASEFSLSYHCDYPSAGTITLYFK